MNPTIEDEPPKTLEEFVALLDRCKAQVEADPSGYTDNTFLYDLLQHILLRLCHGNMPDYTPAPLGTHRRKAR
jgi:hypothetical protein